MNRTGIIMRWSMVTACLLTAASAVSQTIYGTISEGNNRPLRNQNLKLTCEGGTAQATTDEKGSYRLTVRAAPGRCRLEVGKMHVETVFLYQEPTRYDYEVKD